MYATLNFRTGETVKVEARIERLWWMERGLSYTASGYGKRIPTQYKVKYKNKWRRVYCCIYSNIGTCYIGKKQEGIFLNDTIES